MYQLLALLAIGQTDGENFPFFDVYDSRSIWADGRRMPLRQLARGAASHRHNPYVLFNIVDNASRIRIAATRELEIAATNVNDRLPIRCPCQLRDLLAVVIVKRSQTAASIVGRFRDPDVARPALVEYPGNSPSCWRRAEIAREWGAQKLFQSYVLPRRNLRAECEE